MKSKRSKATDIPKKVKDLIWERDGHKCIFCKSTQAMPNAHFIRRSRGGLGVPENIVTLCAICHERFDEGTAEQQTILRNHIKGYLMNLYPDWKEENLVYDKWRY